MDSLYGILALIITAALGWMALKLPKIIKVTKEIVDVARLATDVIASGQITASQVEQGRQEIMEVVNAIKGQSDAVLANSTKAATDAAKALTDAATAKRNVSTVKNSLAELLSEKVEEALNPVDNDKTVTDFVIDGDTTSPIL